MHCTGYTEQIEKMVNKLLSTTLQSASYRLIYLVISFLVTIHWIACIWFTIGEYELLNHQSGRMQHDTPISVSFGRKYARSYYWSVITLVTTGYGDFHPKTRVETFYMMFVMMTAVSLCTAITASFASTIYTAIEQKSTQNKQKIYRGILEDYNKSEVILHFVKYTYRSTFQ